MELILGTAQLGAEYGINNVSGRPDKEEAFRILDTAAENGIKYLDTAASYGESEKIIGEYQSKNANFFYICTKLPVMPDEILAEKMEENVDRALETLCIDRIETLYLHRFEQCKNPAVMDALVKSRDLGKVNRIGISIYTPEELEYIVSNFQNIVDVVQIPYSLLDNDRWNLQINLAKRKNFMIYARSIYLQGLCFKNPEDAFAKKLGAASYLTWIRGLADDKKVSVAQIMLDFCKKSAVDSILTGCEKAEQLSESVRYFKRENSLSDRDMRTIFEKTKGVPVKLVDPRMW